MSILHKTQFHMSILHKTPFLMPQFAQNSFSHVHFAQNSIFHEIEFFSCSLHKIKERTRPASSITLKILESKKKQKTGCHKSLEIFLSCSLK